MLVVAILYVAGATSLLAWFPKEMRQQAALAPVSQDLESKFADLWSKQDRIDLGVPAEGAKIVIVKFNDWMCPACKAFQLAYQPLLDKYSAANPGAIRVIVKDWPWNSACNFKVTQTFQGHEASCVAAVAVRIARDHGKAEDMVSWIFANQERLAESRSEASAGDEIKAHLQQLVGGNIDFDHEFAVRIADVRRDVTDGSLLNVNATPTYYVNGIRTTNPEGYNMPAEYFDLALKLELKRAEAK
jgi:protein-disulfide isomerase